MADFENAPPTRRLGASVTEAFRIDLAQSPLVPLIVSTAEIGDALNRMQRPRERRS